MSNQQDDLAYGEAYDQSKGAGAQEGDRGIIGDTFQYLKGRYKQSQQPQQQQYGYGQQQTAPQQQTGPGGQTYNVGPQTGQQQQYGQGYSTSEPQYGQGSYNANASQQNQTQYSSSQGQQQKPDLASKVFGGLHGALYGIGSDIAGKLGTHYEPQPYGTYAGQGGYSAQAVSRNRFGSFTSPKNGNDVKWYVDGCSYMWAVSKALEGARESIWILDWWLSPELYLRRPPSKNEQYRLDRMLQRAAQRGVRVNIIVYKEVTQALTRKFLSPTVPDYLHSLLPRSTDAITSALVRMGLLATTTSMEYLEAENPLIAPPLTVSSSHTKHALEGLHPNIAVLRHPDHLPDAQTIESSLTSSFQNLSLNAANLSKIGGDALKGIYGMSDNVILYWAHHEKLCLIDGKIAFMGGLDLCFGRWDTNQHPIADVHPNDLNAIVFPGQDYNNARIMDFSDVADPYQNKLDRRQFSRMGWSDISVSLHGPCAQDLRHHFVDRWNFIYDEKYNVRKDVRYSRLSLIGPSGGQQPLGGQGFQQGTSQTNMNQQQSQLQPQYNNPQPQLSNPSSIAASTSRPNSSYGNNPPQFPPPPGSTSAPQPSWESTAPPQAGSVVSSQPPWQSSAPPPAGNAVSSQPPWQSSAPPPAGNAVSSQPPWQSSAPPPAGNAVSSQPPWKSSAPPPAGNAVSPQPSWDSGPPPQPQTQPQTQPAYQQQQQQNPYGLPVPSWQSSSQSLPAQQSPYQSHPQSQPAQPGYFSGVEGEQHFPPPPPGGQPHISSTPPQQAGPHGYEPPTQSQHDLTAAELPARGTSQGSSYVPYSGSTQNVPPPPSQQSYVPYSTQAQNMPTPPLQQSRGLDENPDYYDEGREGERGFGGKTARYRDEGRQLGSELTGITNLISGKVETKLRNVHGKILGGTDQYGRPLSQPASVMQCQIVRSCTKWSAGIPTEHSIQDAYISAIENSRHFVYIENQFFITATGDKQHPVYNQIGKALVDRILRAARTGDKYKVIVVIPSVPGFAGDLRDDSALGTRAIMEFQYNSINRGGHSIMELIGQAGFNPLDYIRFYNLRNYDRLNVNSSMLQAEQQSGVNYEDARRQNDDALGAGTYGTGTAASAYNPGQQYQQYQQAAQQVATTKPYNIGSGRWDSVSECYMLGGEDLRNVPWDYPGELSEIDAFVSEELYIHSKVLIADDRIVICGSANLNDRSQLGTHDSEIAIVVEDQAPVQSSMNGRPFQANRFAASLRRQLFRKHLGLLRPQDMQRPDANFDPVGVPNSYDWGSPEDNVVADPLSDTFQSLWNSRARQNTDIFRQVFRAVPDDNIRNWNEYKELYEYYFKKADVQAEGKPAKFQPPKYLWGHIVRDDFPPGPEGIKQVKDLLSRVKGTLVEMPLVFLVEEDIAKEGFSLNDLTEVVYT